MPTTTIAYDDGHTMTHLLHNTEIRLESNMTTFFAIMQREPTDSDVYTTINCVDLDIDIQDKSLINQ